MNEGMLEQVATPDELYERPANLFVANFIGEPPMNLMSAELSRKGHLLQLRGYGWSLLLNEVQSRCLEQSRGRNEITIGVRPEHLSVVSPGSILPGQSTPDGSITGRVYFRELRGDAEVLTVSIDHRTKGGVDWENPESSMVVETDGPSSITVGDELLLKLDTDRVCIFDSSNGANLLLPD